MARILVVEDDADVRVVFEHILIDAGHEVDTAQTVAGGHEFLRSRDYNLLLSDGRLPDGTGMELADEAERKGVPAVIITGYAFILRELAADPTKYHVLLKPMRPTELVAAVAAVLGSESERCNI